MGVAFQLADDVLDLLQDPVVAGKAVQQDLRVGTLTFPVIRAARNRPALRVRLREIGTGDAEEDEVSSIVEAIEQAGGIRAGRQEIARRTELARSALRALPKSPAREAMAGLVSHLANRAR
jgi:octaprenyl-diphosphate synthase